MYVSDLIITDTTELHVHNATGQ